MKRLRYIHEGALPVSIGFCASKKAFKKEMRRFKIKKKDADFLLPMSQACTHTLIDHNVILICIDCSAHKTLHQLAGTIAHEATHVLQRTKIIMCERKAGKEFEAYLVQYITQEGMRFFMPFVKLKASLGSE